jgi:hypothetical protein
VSWSAWLLLRAVPRWGTPQQQQPPSTETHRSHIGVS